jgi:hypothetical protein
MMPPVGPDPRYNAFYLLTGVTFFSFASGFSVCLFNLDTVDACMAVANSWVGVFKDMGDHIIAWAIAIARAAFKF